MTDLTSDADEFALADPGTTLGQLQRGRGSGWLSAAQSDDGSELLRSCLQRDPRWDSQVEDRADYYARLVIELGLTAQDIDPDDLAFDDAARALGLDVLGRLAVRGDDAALQRLQLELERPGDRSIVLWQLSEVPDERGLEGVDALLVQVCKPDELVELADDTKNSVPWERWAEKHPQIAAATSEASRVAESRRNKVAMPKADAPIDELVNFEWPGTIPKAVKRRLAQTQDASEVATLHEAATGPWGPARRFAWVALAERRDPIAVDVAADVFTRNLVGGERASAFRYFLALDSNVTLPLARQWLELDDDRSRVAAATLARHATVEDLPAIKAAFSRAWTRQDMYEICDLVDALAHVPGQGPHSELAVVFNEVSYSYARRRAAAALAAGDPMFRTTYAVECLWDCEEETRLIGAKTVDASADLAEAGLVRLADDPFEVDDIREAARDAIGAMG
jgi:hypothetical protein